MAEKRTILIAEDDDVIYLYLQIILTGADFNVLHAQNGLEAVNLCRENPDLALILLDIKMPVMNGLEAIREIRHFNKQVPIIVQTAYTSDENKDLAFSLGGNDLITKPISKKDLLEKINKFVN